MPSAQSKNNFEQIRLEQGTNKFQNLAGSVNNRSTIPTLKVDSNSYMVAHIKPAATNEISNKAKIRFGGSNINMSATRSDNNKFTIK